MTARTAQKPLVVVGIVLVLALAPIAVAGKGGSGGGGSHGGGGGHKSAPSYSGTVSGPVMVVDNNGNGAPNVGDSITFDVTANAPNYWVQADCYQGGTLVWQDTEGFSAGWLWGTTYYLGGAVWTSGAASCVATLYTQNLDGSNYQKLADLTFSVGS